MNEYSRSENLSKALVRPHFPSSFNDSLGGVFGPARVWFCQTLHPRGLCVVAEGSDLRRFFADSETFGLAVEVFPDDSGIQGQSPEKRQQLRVQHLLESESNNWILCLPEALDIEVKVAIESVHWQLNKNCPTRKELIAILEEENFEPVDRVEAPGEMSLRGGLIDAWWPGQEHPWRFDYFGEDLESIFSFDPYSQRRRESLNELRWTKRGEENKVWTKLLPDDFPVVWMDQKVDTSKAPQCRHIEANSFGQPRWESFSVDSLQGQFLDRIKRLKELSDKSEVHLFFDTEEGRESFFKQASDVIDRTDIHDHIGRLSEGLLFEGKTYINAHLIFGKTPVRQNKTLGKRNENTLLVDLKKGDLVVHIQHGIARYQGNKMIQKDDIESEFMALEFMNRAVLYVPATQMDQVQRYVGSGGGTPRLHQLGGKLWNRQKEKITEALEGVAEELLNNQIRRQQSQGIAFPAYDQMEKEFAALFPHEETPDQIQVLNEIEKDMTASQPMDRLLCGDVGYGKTELAIRAAYKAVLGGKQVAVLVPTTVLASQHFRVFKQRLEATAVSVACLSRMVPNKEAKDIKEKCQAGNLDILIGTHRLLSQDVDFLDVGLIIIDEEQRFGVEHKEKLKRWRIGVDILTLTATPIPRTLHMSMLGLRDISTLSTAPVDRQAVSTQVMPYSDDVTKQALQRELKRGGQAFVLHNRVNELAVRAEKIRELIPGANVDIGHGRMTSGELEDVMLQVLTQKIDVLVCTTIISNGVDISNVNTLLVDDAHRFGLSELHQLRGRVGRSDRRGYSYFFLPVTGKTNRDAKRRLHAMEEYSDLGAGFQIAMRDLEIRGAGNILGAEQSGHITTVGYELYCQLLEESVASLKGEALHRNEAVSVDLAIAAYLPEDWTGSRKEKITALRRLIQITEKSDMKVLEEEFHDRFGKFPEAFRNLLEVLTVKIVLSKLSVFSVTLTHDGLCLRFRQAKELVNQLVDYPGSKQIEIDRVFLRPYKKQDGIGHIRLLLKVLA